MPPPVRKYQIGRDAANSNNRRIWSDFDTHVAKVYGYSPEEAQAKAEHIVAALEAYEETENARTLQDHPR